MELITNYDDVPTKVGETSPWIFGVTRKNGRVKASTSRIHAACRTVTGRMTSASSLKSRSLTSISI